MDALNSEELLKYAELYLNRPLTDEEKQQLVKLACSETDIREADMPESLNGLLGVLKAFQTHAQEMRDKK